MGVGVGVGVVAGVGRGVGVFSGGFSEGCAHIEATAISEITKNNRVLGFIISLLYKRVGSLVEAGYVGSVADRTVLASRQVDVDEVAVARLCSIWISVAVLTDAPALLYRLGYLDVVRRPVADAAVEVDRSRPDVDRVRVAAVAVGAVLTSVDVRLVLSGFRVADGALDYR